MNGDYYYNSRQTAALFGVALETIRNWGSEFREYLSPTANPGRGRHRKYSREDLAVLALVNDMKNRGMTFAEVHVALRNGQRGYPPDLAPTDVQALVVNEREKRLSIEVEALQLTIANLQEQLTEAKKRLEEADKVRERNIVLETQVEERQRHYEAQIQELKQQLEQTRKRIEELLEERGMQYAKGLMDALERRGDLPKKDE